MNSIVWCEHCRDHFPTSHYIEDPDGWDHHGVGDEYGPYGRLLAQSESYEQAYRNGQSSGYADWAAALDGIVPDELLESPQRAAAWLAERLNREERP